MNNSTGKRKLPARVAICALMGTKGDSRVGKVYLDQKGRPFASFWCNGRWQLEYIDSEGFADQLAWTYFAKENVPLSKEGTKQAQAILKATAVNAGWKRTVHLRAAGNREVVYHDLCDATGQLVEITANGYRL